MKGTDKSVPADTSNPSSSDLSSSNPSSDGLSSTPLSNNGQANKFSGTRFYRRTILVFMFFTGICSFGYEVLLERAVTILVGSTSVAMGIIISTFILGYLSSFYFGKLADRIESKSKLVTLLAILECLICISLILIIPITRYSLVIADYLSYLIFFYYLDYYYVLLITVGLIALVVPLLMGAEIPIAIKLMAWVKKEEGHDTYCDVGRISGTIFTVDSLGAGVGGLLTALLFIPYLGRIYTPLLLGLITLGSGMMFLFVHQWYVGSFKPPRKKLPPSPRTLKGHFFGKEADQNYFLEPTHFLEPTPAPSPKSAQKKKKPYPLQTQVHPKELPKKRGRRKRKRDTLPYKIGIMVLLLVLLIMANISEIERRSIERFYGGRLLFHKDSKYQEIVITQHQPEGRILYLNGQLQISEIDDAMYHEFLIHPAFVTHPSPKRILVIGGGDGGALEEILKHDIVEEIIFVELDMEVIKASKKYLSSINHNSFEDPKVDIRITDGRIFVRDHQGERFDIVVGDLPDPDTEAVAMLYTTEFFSDVKKVLKDDGLFVLQSASWFEYPKVTMSIVKTLGEEFPRVDLYLHNVWTFGPWSFAIASNSYSPAELAPDLIERTLINRTVSTQYYNQYTHTASFSMACNSFLKSAEKKARISTIDRPVLQNPWE